MKRKFARCNEACMIGLVLAFTVTCVAQQPTRARRPSRSRNKKAQSTQPIAAEPVVSIADPQAPVEVIQERYPDGNVKVRREVTLDLQGNYIKHGDWVMYDQQGNEIAAGRYRNNQRQGPWTRIFTTHKEGKMLTEAPYNEFQAPFTSTATFEEGRLTGRWVVRDAQGREASSFEYANGVRNGVWSWNYAAGSLMREIEYRDGLVDGMVRVWDPSSKLVREETFQAGRKIALKTETDRKTGLKTEGMYLFAQKVLDAKDDWWNAKPSSYTKVGTDDRHGRYIAWHKNGRKECEGQYDHGLRTGEFTYWYDNGQKRLVGKYEAGKETGEWVWWHNNGQKITRGEYTNGEPVGEWTYWNTDGQLRQKSNMSAGSSSVVVEQKKQKKTAPRAQTSFRFNVISPPIIEQR